MVSSNKIANNNGSTANNNAAKLQLMKHLRNSGLNNLRIAATPKAPLSRLNNGINIPAFGLGTCARKSGSDEVIKAVKDAIDVGYRHFDCAWNYENEEDIGQGINEKIQEGVVKREDVFVVSKLWNTFHNPELVEVGCRQSLKNLGLEYMDLFLIHFPTAFKGCTTGVRYPKDEFGNVIYADIDICDTWKAMEQLVHKGLVKSIGMSNFNSDQLTRILSKCTIPPAINQVEVHPYFSNRKLVEWCMARGIRVTAYSPLQNQEKRMPGEPSLLEDPVLLEMAQRYRKTVAQVILRWVFQRGIVVIPKSVKKHRMEENFNVFNFHLSEEDMERIFGLNRNARVNTFKEQAGTHKEYPFNIEF